MSKSYDLSTSSKWSALSDGEHTVQIVAKGTGYRDSAKSTSVTVTKGGSTGTLEAGKYQFINQPNVAVPATIGVDITGKMYTLTADNTYGGLTAFNYISVSYNQVAIGNDGNTITCNDYAEWLYNEFTATDTSKLRTITLETDQQVSQEFYDWAITEGNLVKQTSTGETWVLNEEPHFSPLVDTIEFEVPFSINSVSYSVLRFERELVPMHPNAVSISVSSASIVQTSIYYSGSWVNEAYRTITFETAPTGDLLTWLQANGTKQ